MFPYEESDVPFLCDGKPGAIKSLQMTTNNFVIVMGFFFFLTIGLAGGMWLWLGLCPPPGCQDVPQSFCGRNLLAGFGL